MSSARYERHQAPKVRDGPGGWDRTTGTDHRLGDGVVVSGCGADQSAFKTTAAVSEKGNSKGCVGGGETSGGRFLQKKDKH